ncbi:hypothetical protein [Pseudomonas rubra]|uniref:Uncharacterized protein n=1 Tax=Pseudomonas rubra TaxID=2942627 RepID=A0ABT5PB45_9PSED|nr:hypothetical protein [Pseudomonas rubra]MDD1015519.1 hypothetical protein [Pseudomonas rubra]MDD1041639.1 hypothetical protein [Pseudomonas rubra]MDD1157117.1 hypothetical protein [Pseudomonas rubra]
MWSFGNPLKNKKARMTALDKACRLLTMQLLGAKESERFIEDGKSRWPLGYCFGLLQASLEALDATVTPQQSDYDSHIKTGFGRVFGDEAFGVIQYHVSLSSWRDEQFQAGRIAGATEYVQIWNTKSDRAFGLAQYLSGNAQKE